MLLLVLFWAFGGDILLRMRRNADFYTSGLKSGISNVLNDVDFLWSRPIVTEIMALE